MPFFMVDDQFHSNHKTEALIDMGQVGIAAVGLWTIAGSLSQSQTGNGLDGVALDNAWRKLGDRRLFTKLAKLLVQVGLWEERDDGGHQYHDWFDLKYAPKAKVKLKRAATAEMKDADVVNAVKARDGDHCRYCGRRVDWKDRRSDKGATYDHVIPGIAKGPTNLVVACFGCNRKKAQRTPEQAGMALLPPPNGPDAPGAEPDLGSSPDLDLDLDPDQVLDQIGGQVSGVPHRDGLRARSRSGLELGDATGDVAGTATGGAPPPPEQIPDDEPGPAGTPPPTHPSPGHTGSPWHNWRGPPPDVDEPKCPTHHLDMPCTRCTADHYRDEA